MGPPKQDRDGRFSTELFQIYQRCEQALVSALAQMYVQGVSTRKAKAIDIGETLTDAFFQRCCVHFLRNALDHLPRKADDDCLQELGWMYDRRALCEAKADLAVWLKNGSPRYPKRTRWAEENIEDIFTYFRLPQRHHKHMKSTNMLERFNQEIKRRTAVLRIFSNTESRLRVVRSLAVETHENWLEESRYLNITDLAEFKKTQLREAD